MAVRQALLAVDPVAVARYRRRTGFADPLPGRHLRARVGQPDVAGYLADGKRAADELAQILAAHGRELGSFRSILDLGAGSGRILTQIAAHPDASLAACDVDDQAMAWLGRHHPRIDARQNAPQPPTPFDSGAFDLVYSISIFTHLNETSQMRWLAEVGRLLAPGGLGVLTTHGPALYETYRSGARPGFPREWLRRMARHGPLEQEGLVYEPSRRSVWETGKLRGIEADYGTTFHDHAYVRERWSEVLELVDIVPASINWRQDAVLVARREP